MKRLILLVIPALILISCSNREQEQQHILPGQTSVSLQEVNFHPTGKDEYTFAVTAGTSYKFQLGGTYENAKWLHIYFDDDSGREVEFGETVIPAGTLSFKIKADFNTDTKPEDFNIGDYREALIIVEANDKSFYEEIDITQPYPYLLIKAQKPNTEEEVEIKPEDSIPFSWDYTQAEPFFKEPITFTIESNTDWSIAADPSQPYVLVTDIDEEAGLPYEQNIQNYASTRADENKVLNDWLISPRLAQYKENDEKIHHISFIPKSFHTDDIERKVSLIIAGAEYSTGKSVDKYKITFSQDFVRFMLKDQEDKNCDELSYQSCYTESQTINIDSELEWYAEVGDTDNWISLSPQKPATPGTSFSVNMGHPNCEEGANASTEKQEGSITVWGYINKTQSTDKIYKEIRVQQQPYVFNLLDSSTEQEAQDIELENVVTTSNIVNVQSSGDWTITAEHEWLQLSKAEGMGSHGAENPDFEEVTITTDNYNLDTEKERETTVSLESKLNELERSFKVTQSKYIFAAEAKDKELTTFDTDTHRLDIQSTGEWRVAVDYSGSANEDEPWLEFSATEGSGDDFITYKAKTGNGYDADRTAKITVISIPHEKQDLDSDVNKAFDVRQLKYTFETSIDNEPPTFKAIASESYTIKILCSAKWSIEAPDWIWVDKREGSGNADVIIRATNNYDYDSRPGQIVIKSLYEPTASEYTETYEVSQDGFVFNVTPESESISDVPAFIRDEEYKISVFSSDKWSVVKDDNFNRNVASVSPETSGPEEEINVVLKPKSNPKKEENVFNISFKTGDEEYPLIKSVQVTQKAYEFDDKAEKFNFEALNDKTFDVEVVCSGDWELVDRPDWLTTNATNEKGSGNATLTLKAKNNYQLKPNDETLFTLQSSLHKNLGITDGFKRPITVSQAAFVFDTVSHTPKTPFGSTFNLEQEIPVGECYGTWSIKSYPDWMEKPVVNPDFSKISLKATENLTTNTKTGTVRIESEFIQQNPDLCKEIKVSQLPFVFDDTPTEVPEFDAITNLTKSFDIGQCDGGWKVQLPVVSWIETMPQKGNGQEIVQITAKPNYSLTPNDGDKITIISQKNPDLKKVVTISQKAFKFDTKEEPAHFKALPDSPKEVVVGECNGEWNIDDIDEQYADWLTAEKTPNGVKINATQNNQMESREGVVLVKSEFFDKNNKLCKVIRVTQEALQFDTEDVPKKSFGAIHDLTYPFHIGQCDGGWEVQDKPVWIAMEMSGKGNENITITADPYYGLIARPEEKIILASKINPTLTKEIPVAQAAFKFDTEEYTHPQPIGSVENLMCPIELEPCDGNWYPEVDEEDREWLSAEKASNKVEIIADKNKQMEPRQGVVYIKSEFIQHNPKLYKKITVSQYALQFDTEDVPKKSFGAIHDLTYPFHIGQCDGGWEVQDKPVWIAMEMSGKGNENITITADPYYGLIARPEEKIILASKINPTLTKEIPVAQAAFKFDTEEKTLDEFDAIGGTKTLQWEIGDEAYNSNIGEPEIVKPSWIKDVKINDNIITVTATANANMTPRPQEEIIIRSKYYDKNPALFKKIKVSQKALVFDTAPISLESNPFGSVENMQREVELGHCDGRWNVVVVENKDWISVTPSIGSGSAPITIKTSKNTTQDARRATIRIESEFIKQNPMLYKEITVLQNALRFDAETIPNNMTFSAIPSEGQSFDIGQCDGGWTVLPHENEDWIKVSPTEGPGAQTVTIKANMNDSLEPRGGSITIVSKENPNLKKVITISQEAFKFDNAPETKTFKALTELSQQVTVGECYGRWNIKILNDGDKWLNINPTTGEGNTVIMIKANENTTQVARSATIQIESEFYNGTNNLVKVIRVSQLPLVFDNQEVEQKQFGAIDVDNLTHSFDIGQCDGGWMVQSHETWVEVTPMESDGVGKKTVSIKAKPNYKLTPNDGSITIVSPKNANLKKVITISQAAFKFDIHKEERTFGAQTELEQWVAIGDCDDRWELAVALPDWLSISQTEGPGGVTVKLTAAPNDTPEDKTFDVILRSVYYENNTKLEKVITVKQEPFIEEPPIEE